MFQPEHQPTSFRDFIEKIAETRGLTVLSYYVEEHRLLFDDVPEQKAVIDRICQHKNDLDAIQMICAEYMGDTARAKELAEWIAERPERQQFAREHSRELGEAFFGDILGQ